MNTNTAATAQSPVQQDIPSVYDAVNARLAQLHRNKTSVDDYLREQQRDAALKRLPNFEWQTECDIARLKHVTSVYHTYFQILAIIILVLICSLGLALWMLWQLGA